MRGETGKGTEETRRKVMKKGRDAGRDRYRDGRDEKGGYEDRERCEGRQVQGRKRRDR